MKLLDMTLATPAENLALDEALLEAAEQSAAPSEVLRFWEATEPFVVLGRSCRVDDEVNRETCAQRGIPILRRPSGGGTVIAGPGCLMYAVVISYELRPRTRMISGAHELVMHTMTSALTTIAPGIQFAGTSDLSVAGRKVSGNSMRAKRTHLLYHGTLLYDFPLPLISACLRMPPRQPTYRAGRSHLDFVTNLAADPSEIRAALCSQWRAAATLTPWPRELTEQLASTRYQQDTWNFRR